ncbi:pilus assembly protein [Pontixanthobacter aestiaquae]|nr:pilus assembly protein [Pontixanthobacter aestiaquae]MDN3645368.1 pilus assembly protein [Pontixanthobacter aestiaquae]
MRFLHDIRGNIMPMAAIGMVAMAGMVGGGVDVSRAYMVQNRLQNACDAGVLAGRRAVTESGYTTAAKAQADNFFDTNFDEAGEGTTQTSFSTTTQDDGSTIDGVASTRLNTVVMRLFGFERFNLSVDCSASMSLGNSDVVMVLDTTGSMGWDLDGTQTRIQALRVAMKDFYDTVSTAQSGGNSRVRYGFVPYSSSVNVGRLLYDLDPNYLVDQWTYQSREAVYEVEENPTGNQTGWEDPVYTSDNSVSDVTSGPWYYHNGVRYRKKRDCNNARPSDTSWSNYGGTTTNTTQEINSQGQRVTTTTTSQLQRRRDYDCYKYANRQFYIIVRTQERSQDSVQIATEDPTYETVTTTVFDKWEYKAVDYDTSVFKTFSAVNTPTGTDGANQSSTWAGCIQERDTVAEDTFSYSSTDGISPANARDLDIDTAPVGTNQSKWRPMWPEISYYRTTDSTNRYYSSASTSDYGRATGGSCPIASQLLTTMTEDEFDAYADSLRTQGSTYHDIGMIWGARLSSPSGIFQANVNTSPSNGGAVARHIIFMTDGQMSPTTGGQTAYGVEWHDRRVTDNGYSNQRDRHSARFLAVCQAAKAKGIRVWVIAFASALTDNLESCASTDSAFPAANAAQLNTAFQEIAKDVGELRVTQ